MLFFIQLFAFLFRKRKGTINFANSQINVWFFRKKKKKHFCFFLRCGRDSNPRPHAWQACILTNWTTAPIVCLTSFPKASAKVLLFFELTKYFTKKSVISCDFVKFTCQNREIHAIKHIFIDKNLVGMEKSSTFAPCFSWY